MNSPLDNLPSIPPEIAEKIEQARTSLDEMLQNARAVKGENYATLARCLLDFNQVGQLTAVLRSPDVSNVMKEAANSVLGMKLACIMDNLRIALGLSNDDAVEASKLADLMTDQCTLTAQRVMRNG